MSELKLRPPKERKNLNNPRPTRKIGAWGSHRRSPQLIAYSSQFWRREPKAEEVHSLQFTVFGEENPKKIRTLNNHPSKLRARGCGTRPKYGCGAKAPHLHREEGALCDMIRRGGGYEDGFVGFDAGGCGELGGCAGE